MTEYDIRSQPGVQVHSPENKVETIYQGWNEPRGYQKGVLAQPDGGVYSGHAAHSPFVKSPVDGGEADHSPKYASPKDGRIVRDPQPKIFLESRDPPNDFGIVPGRGGSTTTPGILMEKITDGKVSVVQHGQNLREDGKVIGKEEQPWTKKSSLVTSNYNRKQDSHRMDGDPDVSCNMGKYGEERDIIGKVMSSRSVGGGYRQRASTAHGGTRGSQVQRQGSSQYSGGGGQNGAAGRENGYQQRPSERPIQDFGYYGEEYELGDNMTRSQVGRQVVKGHAATFGKEPWSRPFSAQPKFGRSGVGGTTAAERRAQLIEKNRVDELKKKFESGDISKADDPFGDLFAEEGVYEDDTQSPEKDPRGNDLFSPDGYLQGENGAFEQQVIKKRSSRRDRDGNVIGAEEVVEGVQAYARSPRSSRGMQNFSQSREMRQASQELQRSQQFGGQHVVTGNISVDHMTSSDRLRRQQRSQSANQAGGSRSLGLSRPSGSQQVGKMRSGGEEQVYYDEDGNPISRPPSAQQQNRGQRSVFSPEGRRSRGDLDAKEGSQSPNAHRRTVYQQRPKTPQSPRPAYMREHPVLSPQLLKIRAKQKAKIMRQVLSKRREQEQIAFEGADKDVDDDRSRRAYDGRTTADGDEILNNIENFKKDLVAMEDRYAIGSYYENVDGKKGPVFGGATKKSASPGEQIGPGPTLNTRTNTNFRAHFQSPKKPSYDGKIPQRHDPTIPKKPEWDPNTSPELGKKYFAEYPKAVMKSVEDPYDEDRYDPMPSTMSQCILLLRFCCELF